MALPSTITTGGLNRGSNPPHKSSSGNYYALSNLGTSAAVYKSTDPIAGIWTFEDEASSLGTLNCVSSVSDGSFIHIVTLGSGSLSLEYHRFNMSTDSLDQLKIQVADLSGMSAPAVATLWCSIALRPGVTGDELVIAASGLPDAVMGTSYERVDFWHGPDSGTPSWTGPVSLDASAASEHEYTPILGLGTNNNVHVTYRHTAVGEAYRTINTGNTLSARQVVGNISVVQGTSNLVSYDSAGTQQIVNVGAQSSQIRAFKAVENVSDEVGTVTSTLLTTDSPYIAAPAFAPITLVEDGGDLYALWSGTGQDLYYSKSTDNGTTWDTTPTLALAGTVNYISASVLDTGKIAYVYEDGGTVIFNEYSLSSDKLGTTSLISSGVIVAASTIIKTHLAASSLTASASFTALPSPSISAITELSASSAITAIAFIESVVTGASALLNSGSLSISASLDKGGSSTLLSSGTTTMAAVRDISSAVSLSASTTVSAVSTPIVSVSSVLITTSTLASVSGLFLISTSTLTGSGAIAAPPVAVRAVTSALISEGSILAASEATAPAVSSLISNSTTTLVGSVLRKGASSLNTTGTVSAVPSTGSIQLGIISATSISTLVATPVVVYNTSSSLVTTGSLLVVGSKAVSAALDPIPYGVLSYGVSVYGGRELITDVIVLGTSTLSVVSTVNLVSSVTVPSSVSLVESSTVNALASATREASTALIGTASTLAVSEATASAIATLNTTSTLNPLGSILGSLSGVLSVVSSALISANGSKDISDTSTLVTTSTLSSVASNIRTSTASLSTSGAILAASEATAPAVGSLTSISGIAATSTKLLGTATATLDSNVVISAVGVRDLASSSNTISDSSVVSQGFTERSALAVLSASGSTLAASEATAPAVALLESSAVVSLLASVVNAQSGVISLSAEASAIGTATIVVARSGSLVGLVELSAVASTVKTLGASIVSTGSTLAASEATAPAVVELISNSVCSSTPTIIKSLAILNLVSQADVIANSVLSLAASSDISSISSIAPVGLVDPANLIVYLEESDIIKYGLDITSIYAYSTDGSTVIKYIADESNILMTTNSNNISS